MYAKFWETIKDILKLKNRVLNSTRKKDDFNLNFVQ